MSAHEPLTREQVLDELDFLATVEHALLVEYLSVHCALGHDLEPDQGGATTPEGQDAAGAASSLAQGQMIHLRRVNIALAAAGRPPQVGRAASISSDSVGEVALDPPGATQLQRLLEREEAIAWAVDERYGRLSPAVTSDPVFEGDLLHEMRSVIVDDGPSHAAAVTGLRALRDLAPAAFLRATRREAADAVESDLLDVSDRTYGLIVAAVGAWFAGFAQNDLASGQFRDWAVSTMFALDTIDSLLVRRGLLPPFTLP
jgi:hypothetical protein